MKPGTIRHIDSWLGKPLCFALTLWRRITEIIFPGNSSGEPVRKILFLKLIEQGATVLAYGSIQRAIRMVGRENVYFAVFEENREVLNILDLLPPENIFSIRNRGLLFFTDVLKGLYQIRRSGINAVIDMEFFARASAILSYLSGAKYRVGLHRFTAEAPYRGDLMTHRIEYNPHIHVSLFYDLLVRALEEDPRDLPLAKVPPHELGSAVPRFTPSPGESSRMRTTLAELFGGVSGPIVLLNPNASDLLPIRKWPGENFVELGKKILASLPESRIVITGAPSEQRSAEEICAGIGSERCRSMAGKTTLREVIVLYTLSEALVTNDSGPAHFASITDIRSVVMYGPETPLLFGPLGGRARLIHGKVACSPCVNPYNHRFSPCTDNKCMQLITVDEVYELVAKALNEKT